MKKDYYVTLTGSKTNSGDHLIKQKAFRLLKHHRPDREIIDIKNYEPISDETLELINASKAAIILDGPGLRHDTYPGAYPLRSDIEEIKVPIIMFGLGYRDTNTLSDSTTYFSFSENTKKLLKRIDDSGYKSSVRDYLSLNTLLHKGYKNFMFSGCPAMYELDHLNANSLSLNSYIFNKVSFATGRGYLHSNQLYKQQLDLILNLRKYFAKKEFTVVFHDPINNHSKTQSLIKTLSDNNILYKDISTSAENLINFYTNIDLQIGYRVHGHIHMASIGKPSILISEDSRGLGMRTALSGLIFNAYNFKPISKTDRILNKLNNKHIRNNLIPAKNLLKDIILNIENEIANNWPRVQTTNTLIRNHYNEFTKMIKQLP